MPSEELYYAGLKQEVSLYPDDVLQKKYIELRCKIPNLTELEEYEYAFVSQRLIEDGTLPDTIDAEKTCGKQGWPKWAFLLLPLVIFVGRK